MNEATAEPFENPEQQPVAKEPAAAAAAAAAPVEDAGAAAETSGETPAPTAA
jgi:hypothetical protein